MSIKLNVWHVQAVLVYENPKDYRSGVIRYQPVQFTKRHGDPEVLDPHETIEAARKACGNPDAELV